GYAMHLINHIIIFDSYDNTWQKLLDFSGEKQRADGCAVAVPSDTGDTVIVSGGEAVKTSPAVIGNKTKRFKTCSILHFIPDLGLSLTANQCTLNQIPYEHSATLHPGSGIIYYFGGRNHDSKGYVTVASLRWEFIFDTKKMMWGQNNYTASAGSQLPSGRNGQTTVLVPGSQHIIMYGGHNDLE
ncbi:hypothetical protein CU097_002603, partial [Rhizopus azygosporus]